MCKITVVLYNTSKRRPTWGSNTQPCLQFPLFNGCILQFRFSSNASTFFFTTSFHHKRGLPSDLFSVGVSSSTYYAYKWVLTTPSMLNPTIIFCSLSFSRYSVYGMVFLIHNFFSSSTCYLTFPLPVQQFFVMSFYSSSFINFL